MKEKRRELLEWNYLTQDKDKRAAVNSVIYFLTEEVLASKQALFSVELVELFLHINSAP
jgi:hypothetical protein